MAKYQTQKFTVTITHLSSGSFSISFGVIPTDSVRHKVTRGGLSSFNLYQSLSFFFLWLLFSTSSKLHFFHFFLFSYFPPPNQFFSLILYFTPNSNIHTIYIISFFGLSPQIRSTPSTIKNTMLQLKFLFFFHFLLFFTYPPKSILFTHFVLYPQIQFTHILHFFSTFPTNPFYTFKHKIYHDVLKSIYTTRTSK